MSMTLLGVGVLMVFFFVMGLFILGYLKDDYKWLALIPLGLLLFLLPAFTGTLVQESQECENLVVNSTDTGSTHLFEYDYTCQEPSSTASVLHKVSTTISIFLGSLIFLLWVFELFNFKGWNK